MKAAIRTVPLILLLAAFAVCHGLTGGTLPAFGLPVYALLAVAGLLAWKVSHPGAADRACLRATGVLFAYLLARAALSPLPYLARADIFLMLACLLVYLLTATFLVTAGQRMRVVHFLMALAGLHTLVGIVQAAQGEDFMLFGFARPTMGARASGMLVSPNHLAGFLEIAGVMGLSVAWWSGRKPAVKIVAGYATVCCYIGLLLTQSRGGVLCAVFSLLVWMGLTLRASYLAKSQGFGRALALSIGTVAVLLCIGGYVVATHLDLRDRLATVIGRDIRVSIWQGALDQFQLAPVFGTGAGTHLYFGRLFRRPDLQSDPIHAHNDYLELLAEYGLVGAVGMAAFLALHAARALRALGRMARTLRATEAAGHDDLALVIGALAALAALGAHSFLDFNLHIPGNALIMAFAFGILARPETVAETPAPATPVPGRMLPVLAGAVLALSLVALPGEILTERARILLRDEEYPEAIATAARALRLDPWNPVTCLYLGEALRLQAELEPAYADRQAGRQAAERAFGHGLRLFPQDENLLVRRGQVLDRLKRFDEAETSFQAALAADPRLEALRKLYETHRTLRDPAPSSSAP